MVDVFGLGFERMSRISKSLSVWKKYEEGLTGFGGLEAGVE
jgi:hypothetical protein